MMQSSSNQPSPGRWLPALACCVAAVVVALAGCGSDQAESSGAGDAPTHRATARPESLDRAPPVVLIDTNLGAIRIRLDAVNAPGTVRNFLNYVNDGFYAGTAF